MKFHSFLFLLLAMYVNAQDDNPTGHEVGQPQVGNDHTQNQNVFDDNPSASDNSTVISSPSPIPSVLDDSVLKSDGVKNVFSGMYLLAMIFAL